MNATTDTTTATQTDIDLATYVAFMRNGRNRHTTARELGVSPKTVTARVNRHLAHADDALDPRTHALPVIPETAAETAEDAPGTALAVIPVNVPDAVTDDEIVDGEIVDDDAPADVPADGRPRTSRRTRRAVRVTRTAHCAGSRSTSRVPVASAAPSTPALAVRLAVPLTRPLPLVRTMTRRRLTRL